MDSSKDKLIVVAGTAELIRVIEESSLLDIGFGERLNMEGGSTGRHVTYRPSRLFREERAV
jgi:hypothetical protein